MDEVKAYLSGRLAMPGCERSGPGLTLAGGTMANSTIELRGAESTKLRALGEGFTSVCFSEMGA
jgi:hypothetical protein